ncbi:serine/threonine protein kinase [Rossellomorea vietnamensis]|uniref:serine/threonine protein kinase n=1 Tax=Rossellomorea vietnamensis TaxID=218284 RepID=UPI003CF06DB9
MQVEWQSVIPALNKLEVTANPDNDPVSIDGESEGLLLIGTGTDAAVFRSELFPHLAFKVYAQEKIDKKSIEEHVYNHLGSSPYFSRKIGSGENFLVLSFEEGTTLFDCLLRGIFIPSSVIDEVEEARSHIRSCGLNPRDMHLKNILLQHGKVKIIDVSEYILPGNDQRWEYLKKGYQQYYRYINGKPVPSWLMETVRTWFNQTKGPDFTFEEFMKKIMAFTFRWKI